MNTKWNNSLVLSAVGGLVAGLAACNSAPSAGPTAEGSAKPATKASGTFPTDGRPKDCCQGKNECKGLGGCKTAANDCKGKNECKGNGGCEMMRDCDAKAPAMR